VTAHSHQPCGSVRGEVFPFPADVVALHPNILPPPVRFTMRRLAVTPFTRALQSDPKPPPHRPRKIRTQLVSVLSSVTIASTVVIVRSGATSDRFFFNLDDPWYLHPAVAPQDTPHSKDQFCTPIAPLLPRHVCMHTKAGNFLVTCRGWCAVRPSLTHFLTQYPIPNNSTLQT